MRVAYVYGQAGVSGPMLLGALLDAGASLTTVQQAWQDLHLPEAEVTLQRGQFAEYPATRAVWTSPSLDTLLTQHTFTTFSAAIEQSALAPRASQRLRRILQHFADAVAQVRGVSEHACAWQSTFLPAVLYMGSGVVAALEALAVDQVLAAPVNLGASFHPLTAALVCGASVYGTGNRQTMTTVDGAAILTGLTEQFSPLPAMTVVHTGYGACPDATEEHTHGVQVLIGDIAEPRAVERLTVLETNIDDMNPEFYETIFDRLFAQGALDVTLTPLVMKKGRPANKLTVLAPLSVVPNLSRAMLQETSTFGVRMYDVWRHKLDRFMRQVDTCYGTIAVKCGVLDGRIVQAAPEYEACKQAAREHGVPVRLVYAEAARQAASWLLDVSNQDA
jgi:hypothetical protein